MLDTNNDGKLRKDELVKGYMRIFNDFEKAEEHVKQIFSRVDADDSGEISYSEWLIATIDKDKLLT